MIDIHRKVAAKRLDIISLQPPFSFFDFSEDEFDSCESIKRIFSLARSFDAETLVYETIPPTGIIEEENEDILDLFPGYSLQGLVKLSFFKKDIKEGKISQLTNDDLIGYAILKKDIAGTKSDGWHIFESVFIKYPHANNCVPLPQKYQVSCGDTIFEISGVLYCQQNSLNKACAQVALRSLLSRLLPEGDISYRRINEIASGVSGHFVPRQGLTVQQIQKILNTLGILFTDVDYSFEPTATPERQKAQKQLQIDLPYQKYAYSGLESGSGALVGFRCTNMLGEESKHIIPIYGHTFNKDTWAPDANFAYFRIGTNAGYVPSESWMSSFIAHDDNFGPNFCIPRLYIENEKVDYVLEIHRPGIKYSGIQAEALALNVLYPLVANLGHSANKWIERLKKWVPYQRIVFRAHAVKDSEYIDHLRSIQDAEGRTESEEICDVLQNEMPSMIWMVEISTPHLFPANKRKLGEILLSGIGDVFKSDGTLNGDLFILARLPGVYMLGGDVDELGNPKFIQVPSEIGSHTALFRI